MLKVTAQLNLTLCLQTCRLHLMEEFKTNWQLKKIFIYGSFSTLWILYQKATNRLCMTNVTGQPQTVKVLHPLPVSTCMLNITNQNTVLDIPSLIPCVLLSSPVQWVQISWVVWRTGLRAAHGPVWPCETNQNRPIITSPSRRMVQEVKDDVKSADSVFESQWVDVYMTLNRCVIVKLKSSQVSGKSKLIYKYGGVLSHNINKSVIHQSHMHALCSWLEF